jgi:hypothetical protein
MKKFFVVTDVEGEILSGELEFATELQACEWCKKQDFKDRCFIETIIEIV